MKQLQQQFPELRRRYPTATEFGARTPTDLFGDRAREAEQRTATTMASAVAINDGQGRFTLRPLPHLAQLEPIYALLALDADGDRQMDLLLGGGLTMLPSERGRYDAGYGLLLRGDGSGSLSAPTSLGDGLLLDGQVRALRILSRPDGSRLLVAARNDQPLQFLRMETPSSAESAAAIGGRPRGLGR